MRLDKFLWCVRLCKTRSVAVDACKRGHVQVNEHVAKASAEVKEGDHIAVRQAPIWRKFEVVQMPASRVGAKLVPELIKDVTPWEDLEKQEIARKVRTASREPGAGRPTKRDRRDLERFQGE
ncbi:MAG: S4 domain-containing protein [Flavobacteriales bacterium]|nr:S4 domain-containing protein [Flavobacteriales bacterium]